jgi:hypothetical protein
MLQQVIKKQLRSSSRQLAAYSRQAAKEFDKDSIHKLRTTYKELRALLRWQNKGENILRPYKKIYAIAGRMRNAQKLLEHPSRLPRGFVAWLKRSIKEQQEEWKDLYQAEITGVLREKIKKLKPAGKRHPDFFKRRIQKIHSILEFYPIADECIHDIRKMIKDMLYAVKSLVKEYKENRLTEKSRQLKYLATELGEYIDQWTGLLLLQQYTLNETAPAALAKAMQLLAQWEQEKDDQKEHLLNRVRSSRVISSLKTSSSIQL